MCPASPSKPTSRTLWSTRLKSTSPLPIVLATVVPNVNAATKFQNAATPTARSGLSIRVDTTVATTLAASCQQLVTHDVRRVSPAQLRKYISFESSSRKSRCPELCQHCVKAVSVLAIEVSFGAKQSFTNRLQFCY